MDEKIIKELIADQSRIIEPQQANDIISHLSGVITDLELAIDDQTYKVDEQWNKLYEKNEENKAKTDRLIAVDPVTMELKKIKRKINKNRRDRADVQRKYEVICGIKRRY